MARAVVILDSDFQRIRAAKLLGEAPLGWRMELKAPVRSLEQNAKMWTLLTALSEQVTWHGQRWSTDDWKDWGMHALKAARWMPGEDGRAVPIGLRTSDLSKEEMSDLIELLTAFAVRQGVELAA